MLYVGAVPGSVGVTDHGALSGLGDDDHTQYLLADGTRALTAAWDAGDFEIEAGRFDTPATTSTLGQYRINGVRFFHAYGTQNTFAGEEAGNFTLTGSQNTGVGFRALLDLTTGDRNTTIGCFAGENITEGANNVGVGYLALQSLTTASSVVGVGSQILSNVTTGARITAVGTGALGTIISGNDATAMGSDCFLTTTASGNTGFGSLAGRQTTTGANNCAFGQEAMRLNSTGSFNVCMGYEAGYNILGSGNVMIGKWAGYYENGSNKFYLSNEDRTATTSMAYGEFSATLGSQFFRVNGYLWGSEGICGNERSVDPAEPAEGKYVIWMSDGTGKGDDGDIMVASKAGGTTNYGTLFDHSAGAAW